MAIVHFTSESTYAVSGKYEYVEVIKEFAHGCVIKVGRRDVRIMSDVWDTEVYAQYWDEKSQSIKDIGLYIAYEGDKWSKHSTAEVDATDEVWAAVEDFYFKKELESLRANATREANKIVKGSQVKVTGGRFNKGAEGKVIVVMEKYYGMGYRGTLENKLGIATSDVMVDKVVKGRVYKNHRDVVWAWARNCELTVVPAFDESELMVTARGRAHIQVSNMQKQPKTRWAA